MVTGEQRTRLQVGVQIPNVVTVEPNVLEWAVGGKLEPKVFTVKVEHPDPVNILEIKPSREGFNFELETVKEGREYKITVTPESVDKGVLGFLRITTDCKIDKHKHQMAFVSVVRASKTSKKPVAAPKR